MSLPLPRPFLPMEADPADEIPTGPEWQYEPKWDGFRCIAFRDGDYVELQSKAGQSLTRYFPELVEAVNELHPKRFVLDGEIVVPVDGNLSFDDLLQRIHPAASRVQKLAREHPSMIITFDLLVDAKGKAIVDKPLDYRRARLEEFASEYLDRGSVRLSPATSELAEAREWFRRMAGGLDGIIAKRRDMTYRSGERAGMQKIKNLRSADCVVGGFRYATKGKYVGSLLLGLYGEDGLLNHVGFTSSIHADEREGVTRKLEAARKPPGFTGRAPGGPSRWSSKRSTEWEPLEPKFVVEVQYDHFTGGRFRHGTKLLRWRPDKASGQCTMKQVERESRSPLGLLD